MGIFPVDGPGGKLPLIRELAPPLAIAPVSSVFITGISGYLGSALARRYVAEGALVSGMVRERSDPETVKWLRDLGVQLHLGDVTQGEGLGRLMDGVDLVVHSAGCIGYRRRRWGEMQRVNVMGTRHVLDGARLAGVGRVVHVSSVVAVGMSDEPVLLTEDAVFDPSPLDAPYFDTKLAAEEEVARAADGGLDVTVVNPGVIYGPSATASNSSRVILNILAGRVRRVPVGGINVVSLDGVVDGVLAAAARGRTARRYILGGENITLAELVQRVGRAAGRTLSAKRLPNGLAGPLRGAMNLIEPWVPDSVWFTPDMCAAFGRWMWFDTSRARDELSWACGDFDDCLAATVSQLQQRGQLPGQS